MNIALFRLTRGGRVNLLLFQPTGSKVIFRCFRLRSRTDRPLSGRLSHPTLFFSAFFALPYYITEKKGACQFESAGFSKKPSPRKTRGCLIYGHSPYSSRYAWKRVSRSASRVSFISSFCFRTHRLQEYATDLPADLRSVGV